MPSLKSKLSIFALLTLGALGLYFAVTQFSVPKEEDMMSSFKASPTAPATSGNQDSSAEIGSVDVLLLGLKQRLEKQPNDVDGWVLLSKSYFHLDNWQEAEAAFEKAKALGYNGAWQPLPRIDAFSKSGASSQNSASLINFKNYKIKSGEDQAKGQVDEPAMQSSSKVSTGLKLNISLASALQQELSPDSSVFVFVRAVENPGPPLAAMRKKVSELPFELELNDSHAMIPSLSISSAKNVIVGARISMSGNPSRQPGDYEQLSAPIPSDYAKTLEIVIKDKI